MFTEKTEAFCNTCKKNHPAELVEMNNKIMAGFDCPEDGRRSFEISSDAGIFKTIRKRGVIDVTKTARQDSRQILSIIPITDACNFNCAACSMNVKPRKDANYLSVEEILKRADMIKEAGGKLVNLFGGEPTLHPRLFEILDRLRPYKFNLAVVTNGLIPGRDPQFVKELKKRGLTRISIQFDSLHEETLKKLGRSYLKEKRQAIKYALDAGLKVGLNCLVTQYNVEELPELVQFVADQPANLFMLALLSCAPIGHLSLDPDTLIGREDMINKIVGDYNGFKIGIQDFIPPLTFLPWRLEGHPDCGAGSLFIKNNGTVTPLSDYIDLDKLYKMAANSRMTPGFFSTKLLPIFYLMASLKKNRLLDIGLLAINYLMRKDSIGFLNIGTTNYKSADFQDMNKISRCSSRIYTSQGPVTGSHYFFRDESFKGSRLNEQERDTL